MTAHHVDLAPAFAAGLGVGLESGTVTGTDWEGDIAARQEFSRVIEDYSFLDDLNDESFLVGDYQWNDEGLD